MKNKVPGNEGAEHFEKVGEIVSIFRRGCVWQVNYQFGDKQVRHTLRTSSKKEARLRALRIEAKIVAGLHRPEVKVSTVADAARTYIAYLEAERRAAKTISKYRNVLDRLVAIADQRKTKDLRGLNLSFIDAYRRQRTEAEISAKSLHVETVVIKQLVNFAIGRNMLDSNPLKELKLKRPKLTPQPCWTYKQLQEILPATIEDPYHPVYCLLAATAMRIGEAKFLTWDDVDFDEAIIHVRPKEIAPKIVWAPKSGDQRVVPLTEALAAVLKNLPRCGRWVFTAPVSAKGRAKQPIDERRVLAHLKKVLSRLGLSGHLHTFRHSFISHACTSGVPEAVVREWVGHVDREILKHYTHIADAESKQHMERLFRKPTLKPEGGTADRKTAE